MKRILAASAIVAITSCILIGTAQAQVTVPPGQDFYATPVQKGPLLTLPPGRIAQAAPPRGQEDDEKENDEKAAEEEVAVSGSSVST